MSSQKTTKTSEPFNGYAQVAVEGGPPQPLDYGIPNGWDVHLGSRVQVLLRNRQKTGVVLAVNPSSHYSNVLPLLATLPNDQALPAHLITLAQWIARYYATPFASVIRTMMPKSVRRQMAKKTQQFIRLHKSREQIRNVCSSLQTRAPAQARALEVLLKIQKGCLLTELLETAAVQASTVKTLINKELITAEEVIVDRSPLADADYFPSLPKQLNQEQQKALNAIHSTIDQQKYATYLLHGITGSGKTEVYLQAITHVLAASKSTIVLVPEIALTAQTVERFRSRFHDAIAVLHHRLSDGERLDEWHRIRRGDAKIIIGARSAVFSPAQNLGLIIVDEEHDGSYKQTESAPTYSARDVAVMRGHLANATVVLGSATPSIESYTNCQQGKYQLLTLNERADAAKLPTVKIVDLHREAEKHKKSTLFSDQLLSAIEERLNRGEQSLLFLNRRGYSAMQWCAQCQTAIKCPDCDLSLTYHRGANHLACHLCGYTLAPPPRHCPSCKAQDLFKLRGVGTEQVERAIHAVFPDIRTLRLDADTTRHKGSHEKLIRAFRSGKADLLIGTQMVAKGLHFPQLTLVGVLNCDTSLNIPDFRSSETVFQLLTQVAGRAGRTATPGLVLIQTRMPDNPTIVQAKQHDYHTFYEQEIATRQLFHFPPWTHLIKLTFTGPDQAATQSFANQIHHTLTMRLPPPNTTMPVAPAGYAKIKGRFRYQCVLKGPNVYALNDHIAAVRPSRLPKDLTFTIDVDPLSTFF